MKWIVLLLLAVLPRTLVGQARHPTAEQCVKTYALHYGVPPALIAAFIDVESQWNPQAVSPKGAMGLMQLMPDTAHRFGALDPFDVEQNIAAGTRYVTTLMWEFRGDMRLVAAAYYAGDRWVGKKQLNYSNPDVTLYVRSVRQRYLLRLQGQATSSRR